MKVWSTERIDIERNIQRACVALAEGKLVVFPTETCYGMAADATSEQAVERLLTYKGGRQNKAVSILVSDLQMAQEYVEVNPTALSLYERFLPGPMTVVSTSTAKIVKSLESERSTLGVRISSHPVARVLVKAYGRPLTATSANTSGKKPPYSKDDLHRYTSKYKLGMIAGILDAGVLAHQPPSTVVDTTLGELQVVRPGSVLVGEKVENVEILTVQAMHDWTRSLVRRYVDEFSTKSWVIGLQGEMGAGKTEFVKGLSQAMGIKETILSPTYQIAREYVFDCGKVKGNLIHIDTWRVEDMNELKALGVLNLSVGRVVAIEWVDRLSDWLATLDGEAVVLLVSIRVDLASGMRRIQYEWR